MQTILRPPWPHLQTVQTNIDLHTSLSLIMGHLSQRKCMQVVARMEVCMNETLQNSMHW